MNIKIENVRYRLSNGQYYLGTENMDRENGGFLIDEEYYDSGDFTKDFLKKLEQEYNDEYKSLILSEGLIQFTQTKSRPDLETVHKNMSLDSLNIVLKKINAVEFISHLCDSTSRRFMNHDDLVMCVDSGLFENIDRPFTNIIYVKGI